MPTLTEGVEIDEGPLSFEDEYVHPSASFSPIAAIEPPAVVAPQPAVNSPEPVAAPEPVVAPASGIPAWKTHLDRAMVQSEERMAQWIADQRKQLTDGLDALVADIRERRQREVVELETWRRIERSRVEAEFAAEQERFRERLMNELRSFEEQLGLRLQEQEERIGRWWDEAERLAQERFASLHTEPSEPSPS